MSIHPSAIVDPKAELGENVDIGPYCMVEAHARIGDRTVLSDHVCVRSGTTLGSDCKVFSHAVLGEVPQYLGFDDQIPSGVEIGDGCAIREQVTVHRSIYENQCTTIGNEVMLMVGSHVAHDCLIADQVVLTNNVMLAGPVTVGHHAYIGGGAAIHQFVRIGEGSMTSGLSAITRDLAPFLMVSGRDRVSGLNLVGLKRRNSSRESIRSLKRFFHELFHTYGNIREQAHRLLETEDTSLTPEGRAFLEFFEEGKRGFCGVDLKSN